MVHKSIMKAVIQRVKRAEVRTSQGVVSHIQQGLVTLLGIAKNDDLAKLEKLIKKISELRIFSDSEGKMNLSLIDIQGSNLIVSQFTLLGNCSQGRRPSFIDAEKPEIAKALYDEALKYSRQLGVHTEGGIFQADMEVSLVNDGPVTFVIET